MNKVKLGTVGDLLEILRHFPNKTEVVVDLNITNAWGYNYIKSLSTGIFSLTEYGNDFHPNEAMVVNAQEVKALCITLEEPPNDQDPVRNRPPAPKH